jgi:hypothetical protein
MSPFRLLELLGWLLIFLKICGPSGNSVGSIFVIIQGVKPFYLLIYCVTVSILYVFIPV